MKKRIIILAGILLILYSTVIFADTGKVFEEVNYSIKIAKSAIELQYPVFIADDRIYVSLRSICEALGVPIIWNDDNKEVNIDVGQKNIHVSDKTVLKEEGVIPDEETALAVGKIILEKYVGKNLEYETDEKIFYLKVSFNKESNCWNVMQSFDFKDGRGWAASGVYFPNITLNKNTGEVIYINDYSTFKD